MQVDLPSTSGRENGEQLPSLFAEELGLVLEVAPERAEEVAAAYRAAGLRIDSIGETTNSGRIEISVAGSSCISGKTFLPGFRAHTDNSHDGLALL